MSPAPDFIEVKKDHQRPLGHERIVFVAGAVHAGHRLRRPPGAVDAGARAPVEIVARPLGGAGQIGAVRAEEQRRLGGVDDRREIDAVAGQLGDRRRRAPGVVAGGARRLPELSAPGGAIGGEPDREAVERDPGAPVVAARAQLGDGGRRSPGIVGARRGATSRCPSSRRAST